MSLAFDAATHTYYWRGRLVPNVTRILAPLIDLSMIKPDDLERARLEGVAMHRMIELDVRRELDIDGLPEWLRPRWAAWRRFQAETGFTPITSEFRLYHPVYGYAGTLDLVGDAADGRWLIDLKRSFAAGAVIGLQTAAYKEAWEWNSEKKKLPINRRFGLRLLESSEYRLEPFNDPSDFHTFLALLTVHRWREANRRT